MDFVFCRSVKNDGKMTGMDVVTVADLHKRADERVWLALDGCLRSPKNHNWLKSFNDLVQVCGSSRELTRIVNNELIFFILSTSKVIKENFVMSIMILAKERGRLIKIWLSCEENRGFQLELRRYLLAFKVSLDGFVCERCQKLFIRPRYLPKYP